MIVSCILCWLYSSVVDYRSIIAKTICLSSTSFNGMLQLSLKGFLYKSYNMIVRDIPVVSCVGNIRKHG